MPSPAQPQSHTPSPSQQSQASRTCRPSCPVCGGELMDIKHKLVCSRCRAICETCCEGGRG